jgi:hypothetical protein
MTRRERDRAARQAELAASARAHGDAARDDARSGAGWRPFIVKRAGTCPCGRELKVGRNAYRKRWSGILCLPCYGKPDAREAATGVEAVESPAPKRRRNNNSAAGTTAREDGVNPRALGTNPKDRTPESAAVLREQAGKPPVAPKPSKRRKRRKGDA